MRYKAKIVTTMTHYVTVNADSIEAVRARVKELYGTKSPADYDMPSDYEKIEVLDIVEWPGPLFEPGSHEQFVKEHK